MDLELVARTQATDSSVIYGRAYRDDFREFKFVSAQLRSPHILALGSSRIMQIRSDMFIDGFDQFYNAGGGAGTVYELRSFLEQLPATSLPSVLIISLDQDWFHPLHAQNARLQNLIITRSETKFSDLINLSRLSFVDFMLWKQPYQRIFTAVDPYYHATSIGVEAITNGSGFRSDGSRLYGPILLNTPTVDIRFAEVQERIATEGYRFEYSDTYDSDSLLEIGRLLDYAKVNGIFVIGFSPPYAPSINDEMQYSGFYTYIEATNLRLAEIFTEHQFVYHDFTNGARLGTDVDFFDGFHGGERIYLRLLIQILEASSTPLDMFVDIDYLRRLDLTIPIGTLDVFGPVD